MGYLKITLAAIVLSMVARLGKKKYRKKCEKLVKHHILCFVYPMNEIETGGIF